MYSEGKWTKESLIDKDVLGFAVFAEEGVIHIVYSNSKKEIKYCTMKDKQWVGKVLYQTEEENLEIDNLKIEIIKDEMHIFYLLIENDSSDHGVLMHCLWDGEGTKFTTIEDIVISDLEEEYIVVVDKNKDIDVIFITDEGDEISINYSSFQSGSWTHGKRLYGIQGDDFSFEVLKNQQDMHILNKCREDSIYFLDHVLVDANGDIQEFKIYKSNVKLADPLLFVSNNKLYSCWVEENKIFHSVFDGESWSTPVYFNKGNEYTVEKYRFYRVNEEESSFRERQVYGTGQLDLSLLIPTEFVMTGKDPWTIQKNQDSVKQTNVDEPQKIDKLQDVNLEVSRVKSENKTLEKTIASLHMQMKKKERDLEEYEGQITRILDQKEKSDVNCSIFMESQQKLQKELEKINLQLLEQMDLKVNVENKLKECEEDKMMITQQVEKITEENTGLRQQVEKITEENTGLSQQVEKIIEENVRLRQQVEKITEENVRLRQQVENITEENTNIKKQAERIKEETEIISKELEFEKNQSFMDRLLKGKASGV